MYRVHIVADAIAAVTADYHFISFLYCKWRLSFRQYAEFKSPSNFTSALLLYLLNICNSETSALIIGSAEQIWDNSDKWVNLQHKHISPGCVRHGAESYY